MMMQEEGTHLEYAPEDLEAYILAIEHTPPAER